MDAFACAGFFGGAGLLPDIMSELAGDDGRPGGAALRSVPVPPQLVGATYGQLFARFAGRRRLVPLGLYRRKSENATWRLSYVVTNPPPGTRLERGDRGWLARARMTTTAKDLAGRGLRGVRATARRCNLRESFFSFYTRSLSLFSTPKRTTKKDETLSDSLRCLALKHTARKNQKKKH